jgi:uncharacterized membrane protein
MKIQERIADAITRFAGSMWFVYLHMALFAAWLLLFEDAPWQVLTMVVSLEAIFLSTFVMISQNRADRFAAGLAEEGRRVGREDHAIDAETLVVLKRLCKALGVNTEEEP